MGPRDYRDIDGILILDKPIGASSNQALQRVRKLLRARKAGHCGSLDPLATGVLPICLGEATKFSSYLLGADKSYRALCRLGQTTTTGDAEGEVMETAAVNVDTSMIEELLPRFVGEIEQIPPMYSALKHQGRRLYQLAREGKQVERLPRRIQIFRLELLSFDGQDMEIDVSCSKGTYIRTLAEDIGKQLGCGAHLADLRRSRVGGFDENDALTMERLQDLQQHQDGDRLEQLLLPVGAALADFPEVVLSASDSLDIRRGKRLGPGVCEVSGLCRLSSEEGAFIGLGEVTEDGELKAKRLMNTAR
ncbi:MAG: tRNA pseudouridine(55) synthase TruB [Gammaproteobacteria bacterium]|nr:tRNA pseudouridine(55) synthase TruB [Gammaproteobacteria bacterium]